MQKQNQTNSIHGLDQYIDHHDGIYHAKFGPYKLRSAFQPIYTMTPDALTIYAYEALIRPEEFGAKINPQVLFDPNSDYDLCELDRLCRLIHIRNYQRVANDNATLFLNINPAHYKNAASVDVELQHLVTDLQLHNLVPSKVVCEIIEAKAIDDTLIARMCAQLREYGAKIAVDDYGSDHSNWRRFELVEPDILKLDGSVFRNLCNTSAAIPALKKLIESLHDTGCVLLVEGVENRSQFDITLEAGVSLVQGYFLAKPAKTPKNIPQIPIAPFLQGQNRLHHPQVLNPSNSNQEPNGMFQ
jgi:EAL domain-containing protein (putative c-di-GMP-specific phosphodiesterase class I)